MADPIHIRVKKWLEETIEHSKKAVDHGWKVEIAPDSERFMVIDTKKMPFKIIISVEDDITYIAFVTGLHFKGQTNEVLGPVMRDLLIQNNSMKLSKFCLMGKDEQLNLRTDLYTNYMNKKEFNMALEAVIMGGRWLIAQLGQTEDENILAKEMSSLGSAELLNGTPLDEVVEKMIKAGYAEAKAKSLVQHLARDLGLIDEKEAAEAKVPKAETVAKAREENPVDRYIW